MRHKRTEIEATRVVAFLAKLRANWGKRFSDDQTEQEWLNMMIHELGGFSETVLDRAAATLLRSRIDFFPRMQQCIDACAQAFDDERRSSPDFFKKEIFQQRGESHYSLAWELLRSEDGRRAARDKWAYGFWMFVVRYGRLPEPNERPSLLASARRVVHITDKARGASASPIPKHVAPLAGQLDAMLSEFGSAIMQRNAELEIFALGTESEARAVLANMPAHSRWMHPERIAA